MNRPASAPARLVVLLTLAAALATVGCGSSVTEVERVILVTLDTTRADRIGCYGYEAASTPALDGLAAEGTLFEQAVSPVPTTLPSHATMFTGTYPHDHGVRYNMLYKLSQDAETVAEQLRDAGFATAAFPASRIVSERFGLNQGFDTWVEPPATPGDRDMEHPLAAIRPAGEGVDLALDWIGKRGSEPLFVWLHFYDAHWPYTPPFPYASQFRDRPYDGEIAYADAQLGRLLDALRASPQWSKTLVIVAADHGEGLYDHGERYHSTLVYETTQRVPLVMRAPGGAGGRVDEPVTLADLTPTILDLTATPTRTAMRGISLRPALEGRAIPRRDLYFEVLTGSIAYGWAELHGVRYGAMKLIDSRTPELFDLVEDAGELANLADEAPTLLAELRSALGDLSRPLTAGGDSEDARVQLDPDTEAMLASLGYVAGGRAGASGSDAPHPKDLIDLEPEILTAQSAVAQGDHDMVQRVSRYVLERDPTNTWALTALTGALLATGAPEEALDPARRMVDAVPAGERSWVLLARTYKALGRDVEAREALEQGLTQAPGSEELAYLYLLAAFDARRPDACDEPLTRARADHPESSRVLVMEARCRARRGDAGAALESLRAAAAAGFRRFEVLDEAPDLEPVLALDGFRRLVDETRAADADARSQAEAAAGG